jgi:hypothetical protein
MLVLQDGSVIRDPAWESTTSASTEHRDKDDHEEEEEDGGGGDGDDPEKEALVNCIECDAVHATRRCIQCEDVFCDGCYDRTHGSGKRASHTYKRYGPVTCIECETVHAVRVCTSCGGDPYCLGCFQIIHAKGNKVHHEWHDIKKHKQKETTMTTTAALRETTIHALQSRDVDGQAVDTCDENTSTYPAFVASTEMEYIQDGMNMTTRRMTERPPGQDDLMSLVHGLATTTNASVESHDHESEWIAVQDETSGAFYYYHTRTGETQWAS